MQNNRTVNDVMNRDIQTIGADEPLSKCVGLLKAKKMLIVLDQKKYAGIVDESIVYRQGLDLKSTKVRAVLKRVPKLSPDTHLEEAARLMVESGVKHLPVLRDNELLGVISSKEILSFYAEDKFSLEEVSSIMVRRPLVIGADNSIAQALSLMRENGVSRLPVIKGERLAGIVTLHDIVRKAMVPKQRVERDRQMSIDGRMFGAEIRSIMVEEVITGNKNYSIRKIINLMLKNDISSVPIVDDGKLVGLVTTSDILEHIAAQKMQTPVVFIQLASKDEVENIDMEEINSILGRLVRKYQKFTGNASITVYVKRHKERKRGDILTHVRLQILASNYSETTIGEGWGVYSALRVAIKNMEKKIQKQKELVAMEGEELLYDTLKFLT